MQKILPITRVIMRRVHRILKIRRAGGGEEEEEVASENDSDLEDEGTQESENDTENDSQETERSSLEKSTTVHSENPCEHCENSKCVRDINHEMP